jgi:hypothetical protein
VCPFLRCNDRGPANCGCVVGGAVVVICLSSDPVLPRLGRDPTWCGVQLIPAVQRHGPDLPLSHGPHLLTISSQFCYHGRLGIPFDAFHQRSLSLWPRAVLVEHLEIRLAEAAIPRTKAVVHLRIASYQRPRTSTFLDAPKANVLSAPPERRR